MSNEPSTTEPRRWWVRRMANRMEIDRATFYALSLRVWQVGGGAVTVVLIALFFTPDLQGYYFTFASLMAWQSIFELGFSIVTTNVASHEWAKLRLDNRGHISGDNDARSRLVSLGRLIVKWYAWACALFVMIVGGAGTFFLGSRTDDVEWHVPWAVLVLLTGLLSWMLPLNALLEGCNQVAVVNRYRLIQAILSNAAIWLSLVLGWGLWVPVAGVVVRVLVNVYLLIVRYGPFFRPFWKSPSGAQMDWLTEVWPMQWRLAVQGVFAFCTYALFSPVIFYYHGADAAGRMGMTWALATAMQAAALAWVQTRVPLFGMLIARRDYRELDRVFFRLVTISLGAIVTASAAFMLLLYGLIQLSPRFAARLLSPMDTMVFLIAVILFHVPQCQAMYLRAHKRDPLLLLSTISNGSIGIAVWLLGMQYGPIGAGGGYLAVIAVFTLPATTFVWQRCRTEWHRDAGWGEENNT